MAFSPDSSLRDGYQPFSRQTFAPLQQPGQYDEGFSQKKPSSSPENPSDGKPSIPGQQGLAPAPAAPTGQTFAQLQAQGIPRPAPPTMFAPPTMPYPGGGQGQGGSQVGNALQQAIMQALGNPSRYGQPEMQAQYDRLSQNIDDEYTLKQRGIDETMASRGLYDSTMAGGQLSDLNVGRRSAKTDLAQRLAQEQAQTYGSDRAQAIQNALGFQGQQQQGAQNQNQLLIQLLGALGGGGLGELGDLSGLFGQADNGTLGPSVGGVGGPGGFGYTNDPWGNLY